jgi:hypothetical protein
MQTELTSTEISSMSEVIAKYIGEEIEDCDSDGILVFKYKGEWFNSVDDLPFIDSWDWIHEVWEKVGKENIHPTNKMDVINAMYWNNKLEAFTALFNCIEFINFLKQ